MITIQQLSQEVGIGVDTLRVWERRYGFPQPQRDYRGHRSYPPDQLEELRIVKKLQNLGLRPSRIFALSPAQRRTELKKKSTCPGDETQQIAAELSYLNSPDVIRKKLARELKQHGIEEFIFNCAAPLIATLDRGWVEDKLSIAREHMISDILVDLIKNHIAQQSNSSSVRLLFVTINGERHKLGLYMAAALFQQAGIIPLLIQEDLPLSEIPELATNLDVAGVVLSFSIHYDSRQAKKDLVSLRKSLAPDIRMIAGGAAVRKKFILPGISLCPELADISPLCKKEFLS